MKTNNPYEIISIPTVYKGCQFRSRLEASWVAFFDLVGWQWEYEPFDMKGWTPDFLLHFKTKALVECKPTEESCRETMRQLQSGWANQTFDILVLGNGFGEDNICGWISDAPPYEFGFDEALVYTCTNCHQVTLRSFNNSYHCRKRGCYDGDRYLTLGEDFKSVWNEAKSLVRKEYT